MPRPKTCTCCRCGTTRPVTGARAAGWYLAPVPSLDRCPNCPQGML
jgi:hypothetical protein